MTEKAKVPLRRALAMLLCVAMLMSFAVPVGATQTEASATEVPVTDAPETTTVEDAVIAAETETAEYITLPVTIRDFAADGMLFEFNQADVTSEKYTTYRIYDYIVESATNANFDWESNQHLGFRVRPYSKFGAAFPEHYDWWHCVICDSDGNILKVLPAGTDSKGEYADYMTKDCYSVWLWCANEEGEANAAQRAIYNGFVELINEETKQNFRIQYNAAGNLSIEARYKDVTYANGTTESFFLGENNGFSMLTTSEDDYLNNLTDDDSIAGSQVIQNGGGWSTEQTDIPAPVTVTLNSGAKQLVYGGEIRVDLVEPMLGGGKPVYTRGAVDYMAELLYTMLRVPYKINFSEGNAIHSAYYVLGTKLYTYDGTVNGFKYVGPGETATRDLADILRTYITKGMGTYEESRAKFDAGSLSVPANVETYYDAAYFLLHNTWRDSLTDGSVPGSDGYGWNTGKYDKINLIQTTNASGEKCYVFNSGYDAVAYDPSGTGSIYNTQLKTYTGAVYPSWAGEAYAGKNAYINGIMLPEARFDPLGTSGYGMNADTYGDWLNAEGYWDSFYSETNYHLTLESHAEFVYYDEAEQYFTFTGDGDLYLYINGTRVLDLGAANAIAKAQVNLSDVAELCGLSDGMTYDFDLFYMERHGTSANFGIETNIQIVVPSMLTTKTGYQNGVNTGYNGYVNPYDPVVYEFALENRGEERIQNLTFTDAEIGVSLSKDDILLNTLTKIGDLSVRRYNADGTQKSVKADVLTEEALEGYLAEGLGPGEKIVIHGFNHEIRGDQWDCRFVDADKDGEYDDGEVRTSNWYFFNVLYTTAVAIGEDGSTRNLAGTANWVVQLLEEYDPITNKYVSETDDPNQFILTLEAYVQGAADVIARGEPTDIILVLDQSASMFSPTGSNDYRNDKIYELADTLSAAQVQNDTDNAVHLGYYVAQSTSGRGPTSDGTMYYDWFIVQYDPGDDVWYYVRAAHTAEAVNVDTSVDLNANPINEIGETLKRSEPIASFNYYKSQYGALYDSIGIFVEGIANSGVDHRIAVVGFASPFYDGWVNYDGTGIYLHGKYYLYDTDYKYQDENGYYSPDVFYNPATDGQKIYLDPTTLNFNSVEDVYGEALVDVSTSAGYNSVTASVSAVTSNYRHTCPAAGLEIANNIFEANPAEDRKRMVVLFTDGVPTVTTQADYNNAYQNPTRDTYWNVAQGKNQAMEMAYVTKNTYGAEIFAIGTASVQGDAFLDGVSSDYPNAKSYPTHDANGDYYSDEENVPIEEVLAVLGTPIYGGSQYTTYVSTEAELKDIYRAIMERTIMVIADLSVEAVLRDVLTEYFELLPESEEAVTVFTSAYLGNKEFGELVRFEDAIVEVKTSDDDGRKKIVEVSGFDYAGNYVADATDDGKPARGSKLVVKIRVKTRKGFWGGNNVPTNEETSGLYPGIDIPYIKLPEPEVNVPLSLDIVADDIVIYYEDGVTSGELLQGVSAGGLPVVVGTDGTLTPQAPWMDDYADLTWEENSATLATEISNDKTDTYTYTVGLRPKYDGSENRQDNPGGMAGTPVSMDGITDSADGHVDILIPIIPFKDSTITLGDHPEKAYFDANDLAADQIRWVLIDEIGTVGKPTRQDDVPPTLDFTYTPVGTVTPEGLHQIEDDHFEYDTLVDVTVTGTYGTGDPIKFTPVSYYEWLNCEEPLHDAGVHTPDIEQHKASAENQHEFWIHVALTIMPDAVVIDYGLPVDIDPLTNDPMIDDTAPTLVDIRSEFDQSHTGEFGVAEVLPGKNGVVRYTLNTSNGMQMNKEEVFTYRAKYTVNEKTRTAESTITVIPATIIYYEDNFVDYATYDATSFAEITDTNKMWTQDGTRTEGVQDTDRPGAAQIGADMNNIYGYDQEYTGESGFSLDSAMKVTVDDSFFAEAVFTFQGTGFDVIALSSNTTGTITVDIYNADEFNADYGYNYEAELYRTYMVDTYYGYAYIDSDGDGKNDEWQIVDPSSPSALYQVPVMKVDLSEAIDGRPALPYGRYTAVITVAYNEMFDHEQYGDNGGKYDFWLDAIRIYDQANDGAGNEVIEDAYVADGEGWPAYTELRDHLIDAGTFDSLDKDDEINGVIFIDGIPALKDDTASGSEGDVSDNITDKAPAISDYANFGPNNELYLAPGQAVSFTLKPNTNVQNIHLALKSVGGTVNVTVYDAADTAKANLLGGTAENPAAAAQISTATDLYYDITSLRDKTVVILNPAGSGAILSVTNIKMTYAADPGAGAVASEGLVVSHPGADEALESLTPEEPEVPDISFTDIAGTWYEDAVMALAKQGIITGYPDGTFLGADSINRAEFVTMLVRALNLTAPEDAEHPFVDVGGWFEEPVRIAWACGIVNGVSNTMFAPAKELTREEMMTMIFRATEYVGITLEQTGEQHFADEAKVSEWAKEAVEVLTDAGLVNGFGDGTLRPQDLCNRAQCAVILYRLLTAVD